MITDKEINEILDENDVDFVAEAIESLGYLHDLHIVPPAYVSPSTQSRYIDFLIENYNYNYNRMVIFYKTDKQYAEQQHTWNVVMVIETPNRELLINRLKRYFKMKAFLW